MGTIKEALMWAEDILIFYCGWTKLTEHPDEPGNPSLQRPHKNHYHNRHLMIPSVVFLLQLMDGILSSDYSHVFVLFLLIFSWLGLGSWIDEVDSIMAKIMSIC